MSLTHRTLSMLLSFALLALVLPTRAYAIESSDNQSFRQAHAIIVDSAEKIDQFDSTSHWDSVKNLTGVAKAIVIFPSGGQGGFLLGMQRGQGILMTRQAHHWSQPVFINFNSFMFGLLAGGQSISGVGVVLSNDVLSTLQQEPFKLGGTADLTIGKGVSGKVIGGTSGISAMMVSENKGLYFGGSIDTFQLSLNDQLNTAYYGEGFDLEHILSNFDDSQGKAQSLRKRLEGISYRAVFE
ncbi:MULTISPECIES: lipid-binding SYLF domain-containing protein [Vibrio]|uniref:Ysc84 actin-binding domain-containing protein n=1 Tax=Vibrio mediterranei TaxID=689 RepID=A0A3G4VIG3_9VIBR|nr:MULTISPECIES: lipid-binding SYLF domain-containing protein [Vibrio]AYV24155.1 hypothetical protein ECB94_23090 [Vibrio mediterranei]EDL55795.1 hypothetical protein VSAK1_17392 [Vibrio mediterranei AK1]USE03036.1 lipid-binding SYLF domain-containing protein [Vibrio sp. SCSIO 43133]